MLLHYIEKGPIITVRREVSIQIRRTGFCREPVLAEYSSYDHVDMISPHPLLMIAGTEADTRFYSEIAINKAKEPRELFLIEGATHVDMYDRDKYVSPQLKRWVVFLNSIFSLQMNNQDSHGLWKIM